MNTQGCDAIPLHLKGKIGFKVAHSKVLSGVETRSSRLLSRMPDLCVTARLVATASAARIRVVEALPDRLTPWQPATKIRFWPASTIAAAAADPLDRSSQDADACACLNALWQAAEHLRVLGLGLQVHLTCMKRRPIRRRQGHDLAGQPAEQQVALLGVTHQSPTETADG